MWAMIVKEFRQLKRDRRTMAMLVLMPVLLLLVFGYAASFDIDEIPTYVTGPEADRALDFLPEIFEVEEIDPEGDETDGTQALVAGDAHVSFVTGQGPPKALVDGSELFMAQAAVQVLSAASQEIPGLTYDILFNPDLDTSAVLVPGLAGLIIVFVGTLVTSMSVVRESEAGTLEQLAVMPFRPSDVFLGKVSPYFVVAAFDTVVVLTVGILLFDVPFVGAIWPVAVAAILFLFVALGIGIFISSISQNQGQAIQLALMTLLPQVMLSGIIFPLSSMAPGVAWIGYLLPLTYFNAIAKAVMVRGAGFADVWLPMVILTAMAVVIFSVAVIRFNRQLSPARTSA